MCLSRININRLFQGASKRLHRRFSPSGDHPCGIQDDLDSNDESRTSACEKVRRPLLPDVSSSYVLSPALTACRLLACITALLIIVTLRTPKWVILLLQP
ncbi:hypothetical protein J6590_002157 [Homalodisca vitripennis]|nr:hypothetical protein J6590_002157 [Homalodisca vitripennis]